MSYFYKVYFNQHTKDGNIEKSLLGQVLAPSVKTLSDILNLLEPNLAFSCIIDKEKVDFCELSIVFRRVSPDFTDFENDF